MTERIEVAERLKVTERIEMIEMAEKIKKEKPQDIRVNVCPVVCEVVH